MLLLLHGRLLKIVNGDQLLRNRRKEQYVDFVSFTCNVAKCNFGKVNLKAMLSGSLWMQEHAYTLGSSQGHFVTPICSGLLQLAA